MTIIKNVGIVGAGTMGQGIAQAVALAGYQVIINDINQPLLDHALQKIRKNLDIGIQKGKLDEQLKRQTLSRIELIDDLSRVTADLIIEAVVEDLQVKRNILSSLEKINGENTILVSNTSSIPISRIGDKLKRPGRLAGLHFFNPAHIMNLVEVIRAEDTLPEVIESLTAFAKSIGKTPAIAADAPGFIVNRVARHYYVESLKVLEDEVAGFKTIDDLLENYGFRMGPFRLMDLIGVDTNYAVTCSIYESFNKDPKFKPSTIQEAKVRSGYLGRKTGKGFYNYE